MGLSDGVLEAAAKFDAALAAGRGRSGCMEVVELSPTAYKMFLKAVYGDRLVSIRSRYAVHCGRRGFMLEEMQEDWESHGVFVCVRGADTGFGRLGVITSIHGNYFLMDGIGAVGVGDSGNVGLALVFRAPGGVLRKGHAIVAGASPEGYIVRLTEWLTRSVPEAAVGDSVEIRSSMEDGR